MRRALLPLCLALAGCGQSAPIENVPENQTGTSEALKPGPVAVRIGELGPSLEACSAAGTTRSLTSAETLPVRSAPFDTGEQIGEIRSGGRFFVCSRSLDQKWFGIVYDQSFALSPACGVSEPVSTRKAYPGPCKSGWVSSPFVKLIAGVESVPAAPNQAEPGGNASAGLTT
jgi:hypothetical protein